jgi:hypothetical protein
VAEETAGGIGVHSTYKFGEESEEDEDLEDGQMRSPGQAGMKGSKKGKKSPKKGKSKIGGEETLLEKKERVKKTLDAALRSGKMDQIAEAVRLCTEYQVAHPELRTARGLLAREREQAACRIQAEHRKKAAMARVEMLNKLQQEALQKVSDCLKERNWKGLREAILQAEYEHLWIPRRHPDLERARSLLRSASHAGFADEDDAEAVRVTLHPNAEILAQIARDNEAEATGKKNQLRGSVHGRRVPRAIREKARGDCGERGLAQRLAQRLAQWGR